MPKLVLQYRRAGAEGSAAGTPGDDRPRAGQPHRHRQSRGLEPARPGLRRGQRLRGGRPAERQRHLRQRQAGDAADPARRRSDPVGKHKLTFVWAAGEAPIEDAGDAPSMPELGGTMVLDTRDQRELVAKAEDVPGVSASHAPPAHPVPHAHHTPHAQSRRTRRPRLTPRRRRRPSRAPPSPPPRRRGSASSRCSPASPISRSTR